MPSVKVPAAYQGPTRGEASIPVAGGTVRECIAAVESRYPGFAAQVLDASGRPHRFVKLFLNGDELASGTLDAPIADGDEVEILAAIAGG